MKLVTKYKSRPLHFALGLSLSMALAVASHAGVKEVGNGAEDLEQSDGSAWFVGANRKVKVCSTVSKDFETHVPPERIRQAIVHAFNQWSEYLTSKQVHRTGDSALATELDFSNSCDGHEDLSFKFGVMDEEVKEARAGFKRPVSMAVRTKYDLKKTWGKGFIWVAPQSSLEPRDSAKSNPFPDWTSPYTLEGILLHEVGHVMGNEHVRGTIMDASIAQYLDGGENEFAKRVLTSIDFRKELRACTWCDYEQPGYLGDDRKLLASGSTQRTENFKLLMGRAPVGKIQSEFTVKNRRSFLHISDDKGKMTFELMPKSGKYETSTWGPAIFKIAWAKPLGGLGGQYSAGAVSTSMTLTTAAGKKIPVRVERNVGGFAFDEPVDKVRSRQVQTDLIHILHETLEENIVLFGATYRGPLFL